MNTAAILSRIICRRQGQSAEFLQCRRNSWPHGHLANFSRATRVVKYRVADDRLLFIDDPRFAGQAGRMYGAEFDEIVRT